MRHGVLALLTAALISLGLTRSILSHFCSVFQSTVLILIILFFDQTIDGPTHIFSIDVKEKR